MKKSRTVVRTHQFILDTGRVISRWSICSWIPVTELFRLVVRRV